MARTFAPRSLSNRLSGPDRLTDFELGWVAGILEGEGCFCITRRTKGLRTVSVRSGHGLHDERKDPEHKPISQWIVCRSQEAIELMVAVYPHMGARRQAKIREVLAQVEKRPA